MKKAIISVMAGLWLALIPTVALMAQDDVTNGTGGGGKYGSDSVTCIMNISLYREFYKQWKSSGYASDSYRDAIGPWRWVFLNCPRGTENTYIDGVKIISTMVEKSKDKATQDKYIDTLMMVYDQRVTYFGKEGYVLGRKGVDLYTYRPSEFPRAYEYIRKSVELEGNKTAAPVLVFYMQSAIDMVRNGKADSAVIFDVYDRSMDIISFNLTKPGIEEKDKSNWEVVRGNMELALEPYANCQDLVAIFSGKFEANPNDLELLKKISELLDRKKCQEDDFYFDVTKKLYELDPSPESAYLIGKMLLKEMKYGEAIEYLKQSEGMKDSLQVAKALKFIAEAYRVLKNYSASRSYALKAASLDPRDGEPYVIIGNLYAESSHDCGDNELTKRVGYWAAVDKYYRAKQANPDLASVVDPLINTYSIYFPTMETLFFYNMKEGDPYRVECWIQEDTRVRAAK
jgi:tetratricopeptide (TPR) repeat protein